jgi:RHS repeat-associated protein
MKRFFALAVVMLLCLAAEAWGQAPGELNSGSQLTYSGTTGSYTFSWWGVAGYTYLIQTSDDLVNWSYLPIVESGSNAVIEWGLTSTSSNLFLKLEYITVPAVSLTGTLDGPEDSNGLPGDWELFHYGTLGINPNAFAPLENGLTNLQCYQQGINPPTAANYTIGLTTVTTSTTATLTANLANVPSGTTIESVSFYQGDSLQGVSNQSPFQIQYFLNNLGPGNYPVRAVSLDSNGATATASGTIQVPLPVSTSQNWWYVRGTGTNSSYAYYSYVVPISFTGGTMPFATGTADPTQLVGGNASLLQLEASGSTSGVWPAPTPWFLQIASSGTAYHLVTTSGTTPVYSSSLAFTNPLVGFGSQAGGDPLYTGQTYSFGVVSGGQNLTPSFSGTMQDLKIDMYAQSAFASGTAHNVAPIKTLGVHLPRPGEADWDSFARAGQLTASVTGTSGTNVGTFTVSVEYATSSFGPYAAAGVTNYPLLIKVNSNSSAFYLRLSLKGAVLDSGNKWDWMAVDNMSSPSTTGDYSVALTMDFTQQGLQPWQATLVNQPSFAGTTALPAAYQGMSEEDLLNLAPFVTGTDSLPSTLSPSMSGTYLETGTNISTATSPELVDNPILDNFVASMNNDPVALANYVQNQIGLVDALAVPNTSGTIAYTDQSVNFGGVNRSALGVLLEGQGSPVEQCGLLVYLLRKAGVPCAYAFGQLDQMQMLSPQLSQMLRMQLNGAEDYNISESGTGPTLIPVNYPWVTAYVPVTDSSGNPIPGQMQWVHLFPWIKDTVVEEGYDLYDNLPAGYQTGAEWIRQYLYFDPKIRTTGSENYENPGVLFPQFVSNYLPSDLSIDDIGDTIYNRIHYYTSWNQFPHPWSRPAISSSNLYPDLMTYSQSAFGSDQLFDTASIQVFSDRAGTGSYVSGTDPMVQSGTLYTALLNDRRFLLYHTPTGSYTSGTAPLAWANYNMNLSLEPINPSATGTESFPAVLTGTDPFLLNKQFSSAALTVSDTNNLYMVINLTRHRAAESGTGNDFLAIVETPQPTDTRTLQVGDTAAICFNFGQVTHWMLEAQEDKYWAAQQAVQQNPSLPFDIETAQGLPAYLMGLSYYYREGDFINQYQALTKMQIVSSVDHGLAKLSPARISGSATLVSGALNLRYPNVDMAHLTAVVAGDATIQPGSGSAISTQWINSLPILIAASSAQEHLTIQQFYAAENDDAVSTIKLMDIASGLTLTGTNFKYPNGSAGPSVSSTSYSAVTSSGTQTVLVTGTGVIVKSGTTVLCVTGSGGMLELNSENFQALGQMKLSGTLNSSRVVQPLSTWAGTMWTSASNALTYSGTNPHPELSRVFMTLGPVSGAVSGTGSSTQYAYYGMGAFFYGATSSFALISPDMNGAYGGDFGETYTDTNSDWLDTTMADAFSSGGDTGIDVTLGNFSVGDQGSDFSIYTGQTTPITTSADYFGGLSANWNSIGIDQETGGMLGLGASLLNDSGINITTANGFITVNQQIANNGILYQTNHNSSQTAGEPVNTVTGEFYDDSVDLRLNGPMPLEIRRNYGSQNPFSGAFGYGWKMSMVPYLVVSTDSNQTLIYAAEMDGSVVTYRRQSPTASTWLASGTDNPQYINPQSFTPGAANLLNNQITASTSGTTTIYTLAGADGSLRTFQVQSFPTAGGTNGLNLTRPYLQKWQDNRGNYLTFTSGTDPTLPSYGQLSSIQASNGNYAGFYYDTYGHITQAYTGDGNWTYYQYDDYGDLTQVTLPDNSIITYSYRHESGTGGFYSEHLLTQENKPGGRVLQNYYDYFGFRRVLFQNSTIQQGNSTPVQSAAFSYVISATNNTPIVFSGTTYHTGTSLTLSGNSSGYSSSLTSGTSISLNSTSLLSGSMPLAATALLTGTTTVTDVKSNTWIYSFSNGNFTQISSPPQNNGSTRQTVTQTWYGPTVTPGSGAYPCSLQSQTDKRGLSTTYQYDTQGNVTQIQLQGALKGDGNSSETATTTMTYNNSAPVTLPNSTVTAIPNTLATVTDPIGNSVTYAYANTAYPYLPTSITKGATGGTVSTTLMQYGNASTGSANAYGLLQQQTVASGSPDQAITEYAYNGTGFPTQKTEVTATTDPNVVTYYTYNLRGQMTSETDAAGRNTQYQYDTRGNQTAMLRYDENGNLVSWQFNYYNQNGEIEWTQGPRYSPDDYVQSEYDGAGRLSMVQKALTGINQSANGVTSYGYATTFNTYDKSGELTQVQDPNGNITTGTYDAIGEIVTRQTSNPNNSSNPAIESFTYEPGGKVATHITVMSGTESYGYTSTGLVMSGTMADGSTRFYQYDLTGRVVQETLANGSYWKRGYNDYNLIVSGTFYNSSGVQQGTESETFDRRGNVISKTDLAGNTFSTTYDALNRVKSVTGPPAASPSGLGSTAQQTTTYSYDAAGMNQIVKNALGEQTVTSFDALERPIQVISYNSGGSVATDTFYTYSPDHQSMTVTRGSGANGTPITDTIYTDTYDHQVLDLHADGTAQASIYDANGNKLFSINEEGAITGWTYDSLNHPLTETLPSDLGAGATINLTYNAAGELLSRQMPESQTAETVYDSAGRKKSDELVGVSGSVTRNYTYTYYSSNSGYGAAAGLLESVADPRGFTTTTTYDAWMRPSTVDSSGAAVAQQNQNTTYGYDIRGMVNSLAQSYVSGTAGPSTLVTRSYDGYGQMNQETTSVSGTTVSQWNQSWDAAGRRVALNWQLSSGPGSQNSYSYNAAGLLTGVVNSGSNYSYSYGDNGLLQQRTTPLWSKLIAEDNRGRLSADSISYAGNVVLTETTGYENDSRLTSYTVLGAAGTGASPPNESLGYVFNLRGQCQWETYGVSGNFAISSYCFDQANPNLSGTARDSSLGTPAAGSEAGLGVRTEQYALITGDSDPGGYLVNTQDNFEQSSEDVYHPSNNSYTPYDWQYDAAGEATQRLVNSSVPQNFTWDALGRLVGIAVTNNGSGNYTWSTVYDGFGRRVQTTDTANSVTLDYYYDPQVEFLELGLNNNGSRTWRVHGPDLDGKYGSEQGVGGLEATVIESSGLINGEINNLFGDAIGTVNSSSTSVGWWGYVAGGYGALPGDTSLDQSNLTPEWRGHYLDWTHFYYMGTRYYEPRSGRFLSPDPLGNGASMDLYSYANDDPIDGIDPTGRCTDTTNTSLPSGVTYSGNSVTELPQPYASTTTGVYVTVHLLPAQSAVNPFNYTFPNLYPNETTGGDVAQAGVNATVAPVLNGLTKLQQAYGQLTGDPMQIAAGDVMGQMSNNLQNYFQANPYSNAYQISYYSTMAGTTVLGMAIPGLGEEQLVADTAEATTSADLAGSAQLINPLNGTENCVNCATAMDATLAGRPASALLSNPQSISVLGTNWTTVSGQEEVESILLDAGPGSRGIVYGGIPGQPVGHVWNAANQGGVINFIDAQAGTGGAGNFSLFQNFKLLITNQP